MDHNTSSPGGRRLVATTTAKKGRGWRKRGPLAGVVVVCVAALIAALTGAGKPLLGTQFALAGHWVYNSVVGAAFHVDGATANIDAQVPVPGDPGSQVLQGDTSGYVVGSSRITEFGKSDLSVESTAAAPAAEVPVGVEGAGGPYLVYRNAGKVVRLGEPAVTLSTGSAVGDPVITAEGTVWLYRTGIGLVCQLPRGADRITSCPVASPRDHSGVLTVVGDQPTLVDLTAGAVQAIDGDKLGAGVPIGVPVSPSSRAAANDVAGRVAILDPVARHMVLADTKNPPAKPVTVALPDGDYDGPVSTGSAVALVDRKSGTLLTFDADGAQRDAKPIPRESGTPRLNRGEDSRAYVEDSAGTHVFIVGRDGNVQDVPVAGKPAGEAAKPAQKPTQDASPAVDQQQGERPDPRRTTGDQPSGSRPPAGRTTSPKPSTTKPPSPPPSKPATPPPVPASPPGAPSSVSATAGDASATVSWGAAPDNRSAITSYRVSWAGGSTTVSGGARSAKITGLTNGTRYVFTVSATNAQGTGPGASSPAVTPKGTPKVTISEGGEMSTGNCDPPDCHAVNVTMTGFSPNTTYTITLHSSSNNNVWSETETTDSRGNATHNDGDYDVPGETVWVTVGGTKSNTITWE
ncbi:MAG TPA: fibronectin type III domain-containing protein [Amycolatopsis sp.]|nr:fibronectin type III domain-containing protein [Amycolatopsis sp.]